MKIQGALDRSSRRGPRGHEIPNVREIHVENEYTLGEKEINALTKAKGKYPLILRGAMPKGDQRKMNRVGRGTKNHSPKKKWSSVVLTMSFKK